MNSDKSLKFLDDHYIAIDKRAFLMNNLACSMACGALANISGEDPVDVAESIANLAREKIRELTDSQVENTIEQIVDNCDNQGLMAILISPA